ncbi:hypothetical protein [Janthinobacterium sp. UMAB-60]|uniref:hypothetical protein n=1 Tax=Janthinobacterium sp. UMAB-60 TaxID=1365365 RepID=UPI001C560BDB|nr:hypothetical protein [Janthinobacterium sp. UMAB-60]
MQLLRQVKLSRRLALLVAIFSLGLIVYGGWSLRVLHELKVNGPVYQRIVQGKDLVADVLPPPEYILESYLVERLQALKAEYDTRHQFWRAQDIDRDIAEALLTQAHAPAMAFYGTAFTRFIPALRGPGCRSAWRFVDVAALWRAGRCRGLLVARRQGACAGGKRFQIADGFLVLLDQIA